MKRFFQKSYSWLATLLLTVAFAVSGNVAAQGIELPFAFTTSAGGTVDGVGFYMWSADWVSSTELYGQGDANATWGTVNLNSPAKNIAKVELTCRTNSWSSVGSAAAAAATVCETENLGGTFTTDGAVAIWQGSAHKLTFSSTDDIDVYKIVVYLEEGEVVKDCSVDVDHYADNCKPGKHETPFSKYITLYMQENTATTSYTGSDNCPAEVTFTNEAGQQLPIAQFNYWANSDQIGVNLKEEITTPGVYTLHIPEGLVPFASGKWNKEINATWTVVEPDLRPKKDVVFDFTVDDFATNIEGVGFEATAKYFTSAQAIRVRTNESLTFTAPEKASIVKVSLVNESEKGNQPADFIANVGEINYSGYNINWEGDATNLVITSNYDMSVYFTKAIVTLAVEESQEPEVPTYTEPVLKAEDVSAEVAYYIFTDARGGLTVDGDQLKGTKEVGKDVDPTDASQQFAFVNWNDNLYLYSLAAEKFIGKAQRGNFTEEPVDPIYFKNADESTVMLYFDDSFNFNLGGEKQVTIDGWKQKDAGNSFKIMVAEKFDQTALLEKLANGGGEVVEPTTTFKGVVTPNLTSVSSLAELEGIELTFVDAEQVSVLEDAGDGIYVQNADGSEYYAIWHPLWGGTYEVNGNVVTLRNFYTDNTDGYFNELPAGKATLYFEDYGTFGVNNPDADWDGYIKTFSVAFEGAPAPVPFELIVKNNNIVCANGAKVEAAEAGIASDFYLGNEGLTAVGKTATLYKDGNAMTFSYTMVSNNGISFFGGSSQITEPGTYLLEVPAGTYVDAAGNPNVAFYGQWVVIQKDEPVVDPTTKDKYTIKLSGTDYYFTTTEVKDNSFMTYSLSATPEYFYIEPNGNGYTIQSADTDKWVGYDVISSWDFSNDEKVWQIGSLEGEPTYIYKNGSKGFGVDNRYEGAGVYTDKSGQYWVIEKVAEPTEWNGNVIYPETAANLDDLLSYTIEFEDAMEVEASGYDVLAAVFDANGEPYAIALANGTFDSFGSISFEGSKATVNFMKISDLTAAAQSNAKAATARIGGFIQPEGHASVVFAGKSFKVDGELVYDTLQKDYELGTNGTPTGIDTIATESNDSIYDLNGRRVNSVRSGLYIKNGVKVYMK